MSIPWNPCTLPHTTALPHRRTRMEVLWAVMLLAFFTMSRKDNFSVEKIGAFNARHHLMRGDVKIMRSSVLCSFRRSKSNQLNERVHKVLALAMPGKILDPKLAVERAFAVSPHARSSDPAFMIPSTKGLVPLTHYVFIRCLRLQCLVKFLIQSWRLSRLLL